MQSSLLQAESTFIITPHAHAQQGLSDRSCPSVDATKIASSSLLGIDGSCK